MKEEREERRRLLLGRLVFLALLAAGLGFWATRREPRELGLDLDLASALPGDVIEVDATVTRDGHALARTDRRFGAEGAPGRLRFELRARPGPAEVETTLVYRGRASRRSRARVQLTAGEWARVQIPAG